MSLRSRILRGVALAAVVLVPAVAYADSDGTKGTIVSVTINDTAADDYNIERGNVVVNEGGANRKYQWGGTVCSAKNISDANVALLLTALSARDRLEIVPSYKVGAGQARCLVGFRIQPIQAEPR